MHAKHKGHEAMHMEMIVILLVSLVVCQCLLLIWKSFHLRSYQVEEFLHLRNNHSISLVRHIDFHVDHSSVFSD